MGSRRSVFSMRTAAASAVVLAVAVAVAVGLVGTGVAEFLFDEIPRVYDAVRAWLTPPYLYFIINGIIISIAASSRFQKPAANAPVPDASVEEEEESLVITLSTFTLSPKMRESKEIPTEYSSAGPEKPPVSTRLGQQRRSSKPSSDGEERRALGVTRTKRGETLESTWKAITDGRAVPLTRHLKKSDGRGQEEHAVVMKSETFNERRTLRREPSVGQEELNRRVEAFINKFNEEMRLQRQESYQHYLDMINHGGHGHYHYH